MLGKIDPCVTEYENFLKFILEKDTEPLLYFEGDLPAVDTVTIYHCKEVAVLEVKNIRLSDIGVLVMLFNIMLVHAHECSKTEFKHVTFDFDGILDYFDHHVNYVLLWHLTHQNL